MNLPVVYDPDYVTPLPEGHRFPMAKFGRVYEVVREKIGSRSLDVHSPVPDPLPAIKQAHDRQYVEQFIQGELTEDSIRDIGLPHSDGLVTRTITAVGGTLRTIDVALKTGLACNTAGGTHHAFPGQGAGFCIFNDLAVGAQTALGRSDCSSVLILDLDVHQGNGTAAFFRNEPRVHTVSFHCESNYPFDRVNGDDDFELEEGMTDNEYYRVLKQKLPSILDNVQPDLCLYDAGVDVHKNDRLGNLELTDRGLARRDQYVLETVIERGIPTACVIGGGYDDDIESLANRHSILHQQALSVLKTPTADTP
ncbi:MAG: histone deacetylase [bacterium]